MPEYRHPAMSIAKDIEKLAIDNPKKKPWRVILQAGEHGRRITVRTWHGDDKLSHQCYVNFDLEEFQDYTKVRVKLCDSAHIGGRVKDYIVKSIEQLYR